MSSQEHPGFRLLVIRATLVHSNVPNSIDIPRVFLMLRSIQLQNFRSFDDTGRIELRKLNVLIGANNAGKSSFLSAVELFLRSMKGGGSQGPLTFGDMPSFASFDSVLRRHWSPNESRPKEFSLYFDWSAREAQRQISYAFACRGRQKDNTSYVHKASYKFEKMTLTAKLRGSRLDDGYEIRVGRKAFRESGLFFRGLFPFEAYQHAPKLIPFFSEIGRFPRLEVVHPYRPIPRSFYVLDDPGLASEDRELLSFLIRVWNPELKIHREMRERIKSNLATLGLARDFDIKQVSTHYGPKVFEIRVSPTILRHNVTIADAGFGLSQALPLVAYDARLKDGYFVAYQPEVHLHPFAQSRLADIFSNSVKRGNQVFVETHSPDLVLRLQTMVVKNELSPDDVRIFCFENRKGRSYVTPIDLNLKGTPTIQWPAGFLDTSFTLARELASERLKKK